MQEDTQLPTTPPLSGPDLVDKSNKAFQTIASDFYGNVDPVSKAWPGSVWAHPAEGVYKRLNDAGSAWVVEGRLFKAHLPMYLEAEIPTTNIGDIHVIGKGPYTWGTSAYVSSIVIPAPTAAQVSYDNSTSGLGGSVQGAIDDLAAGKQNKLSWADTFDPGSKADKGATVQHKSASVEFSNVYLPTAGTYDLPATYVLTGVRSTGAGAEFVLRGRTLSNQ